MKAVSVAAPSAGASPSTAAAHGDFTTREAARLRCTAGDEDASCTTMDGIGFSLDGKLNEIGRMMAGNLGGAMSGGLVIPVIAVYDQKQAAGRIFFYDAAGARFENLEYAAAGSGSVQIRGAFEYIVRTKGNFSEMTLETALAEALHLLEIAADLDSATGGAGKVLPLARTVTAAGVTEISDDAIRVALGASTTTATSI